MEHTPTPWLGNSAFDTINRSDTGDLVAFVEGVDVENFNFIVRACNSHDELLAACKESYSVLTLPGVNDDDLLKAMILLKAAIAHAEAEK